jgi:gliding motility-associated protein GldL
MAKKNKSIFHSRGWKVGMKYLYGWGASIVILGALFKILHFPGANIMLIVGLGTESVIFFFSAFEPLPAENKSYDWERVFPQLGYDEDELEDLEGTEGTPALGGGGGVNLPDPGESGLTPEVFENLRDSVEGLKKNVDNLSDISDATVASQEFSDKLRSASQKIDELSSGYSTTVEAMNSFSSSIQEVQNYQEQLNADVKTYQNSVQAVTQNLDSLNSVYEVELQDAQKHLNSINKFYGSISGVMENLMNASQDTDQLRQEVSQLASNMQSLNTVYGNMLNAMTGSGSKS